MATDPTGNIAVDQPTYQREGNPRLVSVDARATPDDFGGGRGLAGLAQGLDSAGSAIDEISAKRDDLWAQQQSTKAAVDWQQNMAMAKQAFELDPSKGSDYADTFKTNFAAYQQSILDNNPDVSDRAKNLMMTRTNTLGSSLFGDALNLQAKAATDWSIQSTQSTMDNIKQLTNSPNAWVGYKADGSPDTSFFDNKRSQVIDAVSTSKGTIPSAMSREMLLQSNLEIDKAEIDTASAQRGAGQTAKWIADGHLGTALSIPQRQEQVLELQRQQTEDTTQDIRSAHQGANNYGMSLMMGAPRDPLAENQINAGFNKAYGTYGPSYAADAAKKFETDVTFSQDQKQLDALKAEYGNKFTTQKSKDDFFKTLQDPNHTITPEEANDAFYLNFLPHLKEGGNPIDLMNMVNKQQADFKQNVADAKKVSQVRASLVGMSVDELQLTKDGLGDPATDNISKQLGPIISNRLNAMKTDNFSVVAQDDKTVGSLLNQSQNKTPSLTSMIGESNDDRSNAIYQQAATRSVAIQLKTMPNETPMVMSKPEGDYWLNQYKNAKSSQAVSDLVGSMQSKFGPLMDQAVTQLQSNKDNPLPAGFSLAIANKGEPNELPILNSQRIPDGEGLPKSETNKEPIAGYTKLFKDRGQEAAEKDIESKVTLDPIFDKYRQASGGFSPLITDLMQSTARYAKYSYLNSSKADPDNTQPIVTEAIQNAVGKHIDFGDNPNGPAYLINRDTPTGRYNDEDTAQIKTNLASELKTYPAAINENAYWSTKSDLTGVSLLIPNRDGGLPIPVPNSFRSFQDMRNKKPEPTNTEHVGTLGRLGDL